MVEGKGMPSFMQEIRNCARCGGDHSVVFWKITRPISIGDRVFTYWGTCPDNNEPILMEITEDDKEVWMKESEW